jgi:hypothetical protein
MSTWKHSRQGDVMQDVPDADERPDDQDVVVIKRAVQHQPVGVTAAKSERDAILWSHDPKDLEAWRR